MSIDNVMAALEAFNEEKKESTEQSEPIIPTIPEKSVSVPEITKQEDVVDNMNHSPLADVVDVVPNAIDQAALTQPAPIEVPVDTVKSVEPKLTEKDFYDAIDLPEVIDYLEETERANTSEEITDAPFDYGSAIGWTDVPAVIEDEDLPKKLEEIEPKKETEMTIRRSVNQDAVVQWAENMKKLRSPKKSGRPSKMTKEVIRGLYEALKLDLTIEQACRLVGIKRTTYHQWRDLYPEFGEFMEEARQHVVSMAKANVARSVAAGDEDMSKWVLERRARDEYAPKVDVNQTWGGSIQDILLALANKDKNV